MPCPPKKIIIAIDGFSSCGKSTFAREISTQIGYIFIDTGAMYRAVTLYGIQNGAISGNKVDEEKLVNLLDDISITFEFNPDRRASDVLLNGENVEQQIRTIEVSNRVSRVSQVAAVRQKLVSLQQAMGEQKGIVMDGRDIGTVVFPSAELKIFMTADMDVRVDRRYRELQAKGIPATRDEIEQNIRQRDYADQNRAIAPLKKAEDAILLDNSRMTVSEQMDWVMERIDKLTVCI